MKKRIHIQPLIVALIVLVMGAIPVVYAVNSLRSTQSAVVRSHNHDSVLESIAKIRSKGENHLRFFAASALDLSDVEREDMLFKAGQHLREFGTAIKELLKADKDHIQPTERDGLTRGLSVLYRNWEAIQRDKGKAMSGAERTWHFLGMVESFGKLNRVLLGLHNRVSTEHEVRLDEIFGNIEFAILTIAILTVVGTGLASTSLGGAIFVLNRSRAQASQLRESNDLLIRREEALQLQSDRFSSAIQHMAQGLCMIDKDHRLITWNDKFARMYDIPERLLQEGLPYRAVLEHRVKSGTAPLDCPDYIDHELGDGESSVSHSDVYELADGRFVSTSFEPTPEGGMLSTHSDVTEWRQSEQQIMHLAHHDGLTNLMNRRSFVEALENAMNEVAAGAGLTFFAVDLDDFKLANDKFGHAAGDLVLRSVANRLKACTREEDLIARVGGDEFAVVLPGETSQEGVSKFAERIVEELSKPYDFEGQLIEIGTSVGAARAPHDACDADGLMKMADVALYEAKDDGRNQSRLFSADMLDMLLERRQLEDSLAHALERNEFELHYQPLMCAHNDLVVGVEALLRWSHPELGPIPPSKFVPIAEDLGMMGRLGGWIIEQACLDATKWPAPIRVSVNVSAAQFHTRALELDIALALGKSGLPGDRLELEITESVLLDDEDKVLSTIDKVQEMGVSVSMDDFGTGFSSLSYLHKYPLDKIKIDRSFIMDLPGSNHSLSIVRTIVSLARSIGMSTTAEGIETAEQYSLLKEEGCDQLQGYLISKPVPAGDILGLIQTLNVKNHAAA